MLWGIARFSRVLKEKQFRMNHIMKTTNVAIVNGISLQVVADERWQLVAVKPVYEIFGVDFSAQRSKLNEHPVLSSTMVQCTTVGADGKDCELLCIPLQFFFGWLFSINPDIMKGEARERLIEYQLVCNKVIFDYFFGRAKFAQKKEQELELRQSMPLTFEEWQADRQQLTIPGFE